MRMASRMAAERRPATVGMIVVVVAVVGAVASPLVPYFVSLPSRVVSLRVLVDVPPSTVPSRLAPSPSPPLSTEPPPNARQLFAPSHVASLPPMPYAHSRAAPSHVPSLRVPPASRALSRAPSPRAEDASLPHSRWRE